MIMKIAFMMEAVSTSETSVNIYQTTRRNIPEDSHLHARRREKFHQDDNECRRKRKRISGIDTAS
jgi:hypothetical protein